MKTIKDQVVYVASAPCVISKCDITLRSNEHGDAEDARSDAAYKLQTHLNYHHQPGGFYEFVEVSRIDRTIIDNATPVTED